MECHKLEKRGGQNRWFLFPYHTFVQSFHFDSTLICNVSIKSVEVFPRVISFMLLLITFEMSCHSQPQSLSVFKWGTLTKT